MSNRAPPPAAARQLRATAGSQRYISKAPEQRHAVGPVLIGIVLLIAFIVMIARAFGRRNVVMAAPGGYGGGFGGGAGYGPGGMLLWVEAMAAAIRWVAAASVRALSAALPQARHWALAWWPARSWCITFTDGNRGDNYYRPIRVTVAAVADGTTAAHRRIPTWAVTISVSAMADHLTAVAEVIQAAATQAAVVTGTSSS